MPKTIDIDPNEPSKGKKTSPSPAQRVRASKLRGRAKAGLPLSPEEAAELHDYESDRAEAKGASQSRRVSYTEEESAAIGTGSAAAEAAAAGAMVREEGRRLDSVLTVGITALRTACDQYAKMVETMSRRTEKFEETLVKMMTAQTNLIDRVRESELERIDAEINAAAIAAEAEQAGEKGGDAISKMVEELLPVFLAKLGGKGGEGGQH
jgi:hypothetical protein